jgi:hypothetical protein
MLTTTYIREIVGTVNMTSPVFPFSADAHGLKSTAKVKARKFLKKWRIKDASSLSRESKKSTATCTMNLITANTTTHSMAGGYMFSRTNNISPALNSRLLTCKSARLQCRYHTAIWILQMMGKHYLDNDLNWYYIYSRKFG